LSGGNDDGAIYEGDVSVDGGDDGWIDWLVGCRRIWSADSMRSFPSGMLGCGQYAVLKMYNSRRFQGPGSKFPVWATIRFYTYT